MSVARNNFESRISTLRDSLNDPAVADGSPSEVQKNAIASMLRNGLAVLAFAITEDFIRDRTAEVLTGFSNTTVRFEDLSDDLQQAITFSALKGVLFRAKLQEETTRIQWLLSQLPPISLVASNISSLSKYSFGHSSSNLTDDDPTKILAAFGVVGGWAAISKTAKRIGLGGVPDYAQAFKDLAKRRHSAAHTVATVIPLNDLLNSVKSIIGICCSFDLLLSKALYVHNTGNIPDKKKSPVADVDLNLRFISPHPTQAGKYREQVESKNKSALHTTRVFVSENAARVEVGAKAIAQGAYVIFLGGNGIPRFWETW